MPGVECNYSMRDGRHIMASRRRRRRLRYKASYGI
jgi:hypothetical protein